jgi:hypothetical protein
MANDAAAQYKLWNAFSCMLYRQNQFQERYKIGARMFQNIKERGALIKSNRLLGNKNPMYGKRGELSHLYGRAQSSDHIEKRRQLAIGKKRTIESRLKQSQSTKGKLKTEEWKSLRSVNSRGENNSMFGKKLSPETIAKRTATMRANKLAKNTNIEI